MLEFLILLALAIWLVAALRSWRKHRGGCCDRCDRSDNCHDCDDQKP